MLFEQYKSYCLRSKRFLILDNTENNKNKKIFKIGAVLKNFQRLPAYSLSWLRALVERLTADGVFARLVPSGGIAFHTKYIYESGQVVLDFLKGVLKNPKPRSPKWVSSSVPPEKLHLEWTGMNCPEYHYNNYISPVRFEEVSVCDLNVEKFSHILCHLSDWKETELFDIPDSYMQ